VHYHYGVDGEVGKTLKEWHRVLKPGGKLYVAVFDLYVLSDLILDKSLTKEERFFVMSMMYGGQTDMYDVYKVGFTEEILEAYLKYAGFCNFRRVESFGFSEDFSNMEYKGRKIGLNIIATSC
jgi:predicted SAM-dependent methyltransferase